MTDGIPEKQMASATRIVDDWPELTDDELDDVAALLQVGGATWQ